MDDGDSVHPIIHIVTSSLRHFCDYFFFPTYFDFPRDNFLFIDFFFRELSYQRIEQQQAYDFFALLSKHKYLYT